MGQIDGMSEIKVPRLFSRLHLVVGVRENSEKKFLERVSNRRRAFHDFSNRIAYWYQVVDSESKLLDESKSTIETRRQK